jgi:hypothetical protein
MACVWLVFIVLNTIFFFVMRFLLGGKREGVEGCAGYASLHHLENNRMSHCPAF